jgi:hypothetical protein
MANLLTLARRLVCRLDGLEIAYPVARSASAFSALVDERSAQVLREHGPRFYVVEDDRGGYYPARLEALSEPLGVARRVRISGFVVPRR